MQPNPRSFLLLLPEARQQQYFPVQTAASGAGWICRKSNLTGAESAKYICSADPVFCNQKIIGKNKLLFTIYRAPNRDLVSSWSAAGLVQNPDPNPGNRNPWPKRWEQLKVINCTFLSTSVSRSWLWQLPFHWKLIGMVEFQVMKTNRLNVYCSQFWNLFLLFIYNFSIIIQAKLDLSCLTQSTLNFWILEFIFRFYEHEHMKDISL